MEADSTTHLVAPFSGADSDWVRNVLAVGSCTLERGGRQVDLNAPRMLDISDGMTLVPVPRPRRLGP